MMEESWGLSFLDGKIAKLGFFRFQSDGSFWILESRENLELD